MLGLIMYEGKFENSNIAVEIKRGSLILDVRNFQCPIPVIRTKNKLKTLKTGDLIVVFTTDPIAPLDIQHFCNTNGHVVLEMIFDKNEGGHKFLIKKGSK